MNKELTQTKIDELEQMFSDKGQCALIIVAEDDPQNPEMANVLGGIRGSNEDLASALLVIMDNHPNFKELILVVACEVMMKGGQA